MYIKLHVPRELNFKVSPKFHCPYCIHKILPHNKYEVISEKDLEKWVVHWNYIKITTSDPWSRTELKSVDNEGPGSGDVGGTCENCEAVDSSGTCQYPLRN